MPKRPNWKPPVRLLLISVLVTVVSYFPVGYHMVVLNVPHDVYQNLINESYTKRFIGEGNATALSESQLAVLWSITVSSWQIGSLFGALNAFWVADRFGRKCTLMLIAGPLQLAGSIFMVLAPQFRLFDLLVIGRLLAGVSSGIVAPILHVFLSECSPDRYRGTLNSMAGFVVALGVVLAMIVGLPECFGTEETLQSQLLLGFCIPMNILQIVTYPLFPPTPKFLYLTKRKQEEAKASVVFYHGENADVKSVFDELEVERILADQQLPFFKAIRLRSVRLPLCLSIVAGVCNSSIGVDVTDAYSTELFTNLGLPDQQAKVASMLFSVAGIIGSAISIFVIDRFRRRTLLLSTLAVCFLANIAMIYVGALGRFGLGGRRPGVGFGSAMAVLISVMELAYGIGPGAILEGLFAEVSPHRVRAAAGSLSTVAYCSTNWFFVFAFPPASVSMGAFAFLIHVIPSCLCLLYFAYYLPETGRKSVTEVAKEMMRRSKKMAAQVERASQKNRGNVTVIEKK